MGNKYNPYFNQSGYADPTAYQALKPIIKEETEIERKANELIKVLKYVANNAGFDFIGRIEIKHRGSGKEFR